MRHLTRSLVLAALAAVGTVRQVRAQPQPPSAAAAHQQLRALEEIAIVERKVMLPMRDGIRLATDVYRPKAGTGKYPTIFVRTPYNFNWWDVRNGQPRDVASILTAVRRGYAYVVQNERGHFFSEGEWDILGPPITDGYDAIDWISQQTWSNNKVGLVGCSSTAEWQMAVASLGHPALAAIVPQGYGAGVGRIGKWYEQGNWYRGGAIQMLFIAWLYGEQNTVRPMFPREMSSADLERMARYYDLDPQEPPVDWSKALTHLPVQDLLKNVGGPRGVFADQMPVATGGRMVQRTPDDPAWYQGGLYHDNMPFNVPALWLMSWYDVSVGPNMALFNHARAKAATAAARDAQYALVAPVAHCSYTRATEETVVGERSMGDARYNYDGMVYGWFDHWLKGERNGLLDTLPKVRYYTMGANKWQTTSAWPPAGFTTMTYYLSSRGKANSLFGDGRLVTTMPGGDPPDQFVYDPMNPVPSYGGNVCCTGNAIQAGAFDQRKMEARQDILVYTTEPFAEGVEVSGPVEVTLYVSSDARDTDVTVKLLDVYPDGRAYNLDETIQRLRYRDGYGKKVLMEPGKAYQVEVGPLTTSNWFATGHRLRIEVSSSNFPRFDRNLNTGGNNYDEAMGVVARNTIHHSRQYPSQIRVTMVKR
jgi:hypothetical protein